MNINGLSPLNTIGDHEYMKTTYLEATSLFIDKFRLETNVNHVKESYVYSDTGVTRAHLFLPFHCISVSGREIRRYLSLMLWPCNLSLFKGNYQWGYF